MKLKAEDVGVEKFKTVQRRRLLQQRQEVPSPPGQPCCAEIRYCENSPPGVTQNQSGCQLDALPARNLALRIAQSPAATTARSISAFFAMYPARALVLSVIRSWTAARRCGVMPHRLSGIMPHDGVQTNWRGYLVGDSLGLLGGVLASAKRVLANSHLTQSESLG